MNDSPRWTAAPAAHTRIVAALVLGTLGVAAPAPAQQPEAGVEAAVATVRERVALVHQGLPRADSSATPFETPGGTVTVTAFRQAGALRKLVARFEGDGAGWQAEYVYWEDSLVFAFRRWERFPEVGDSRVSEDRWYVAGGSPVRWLRRDEDGTRRTRHAADPAFAREAQAALAQAACWRRVAESRGDAAVC